VKLLLDTYHTRCSAAHAIAAKTDATQETPLLVACASGALEVVHYLLELGANILDHNSYGNTPLHLVRIHPFDAQTKLKKRQF
jgi:ankyrin repeat protein